MIKANYKSNYKNKSNGINTNTKTKSNTNKNNKSSCDDYTQMRLTEDIKTILETQIKVKDDIKSDNTNEIASKASEILNLLNDMYSNKGKNYKPYGVYEWAKFWYDNYALNDSNYKYVKGKFSPNSYRIERVRLKYIFDDKVFSNLKIDKVSESDILLFYNKLKYLKNFSGKDGDIRKKSHTNTYDYFDSDIYSFDKCSKLYNKIYHLLPNRNNNNNNNKNNNLSYTLTSYEKNKKYAKDYEIERFAKKSLTNKSKKNVIDFLRMAFRCAKKLEIIKNNPFDNFNPNETRERINPKKIALSENERDIFLKAAEGHRYFDIYLLMAFTGMRTSEAIGLTCNCFNEEENFIQIKNQLSSSKDLYWETNKNTDALSETKSMHSARNIPVYSRELISMLKKRCSGKNDNDFIFGGIDCDIFLTRKLLYSETKKIFNKCFLVTGNKKYLECSNHTLRHTFATIFLTNYPEQLTQTSALLGHSNTSFTAKQYIHLETEKIDISKMKDREI